MKYRLVRPVYITGEDLGVYKGKDTKHAIVVAANC